MKPILYPYKHYPRPRPYDIRFNEDWIDESWKADILARDLKYKSTLPNYTFLVPERDSDKIYNKMKMGDLMSGRQASDINEVEAIKKEMNTSIFRRATKEKYDIHLQRIEDIMTEKKKLEQDFKNAPVTTALEIQEKNKISQRLNQVKANFSEIKADYDREKFFLDADEISGRHTKSIDELKKLKHLGKITGDVRFKNIDEEIWWENAQNEKINEFIKRIEPTIRHPFILNDYKSKLKHLRGDELELAQYTEKAHGKTPGYMSRDLKGDERKKIYNTFVREINKTLGRIKDWNLKINKITHIRNYDMMLIKDEKLKDDIGKYLHAHEEAAKTEGFENVYKFQNTDVSSAYLPKLGAMRHRVKQYPHSPYHRQTLAMMQSLMRGIESMAYKGAMVDISELNKYRQKINKRSYWKSMGMREGGIPELRMSTKYGNYNKSLKNIIGFMDLIEQRLSEGTGEYSFMVYDKHIGKTHDPINVGIRGHRPKPVVMNTALPTTNTLTGHDKINEGTIGKGVEYYIHKNDTEFHISRSISKGEFKLLVASIKRQAVSLDGSALYIRIGKKAFKLMNVNSNTNLIYMEKKILPFISSRESINLYLHSGKEHKHYTHYGGFLEHSIIANNEKLRNKFM